MKINVNAYYLMRAVRACEKISDKNDYAGRGLNVIRASARGETLTLTALDGYKLYQRKIDCTVEEEGACNLPLGMLACIKIPAAKQLDTSIMIESENGAVSICSGYDGTRITKPVGDKYPDVDKLLPAENFDRVSIAISPDRLKEVANAFDGAGGGYIRMSVPTNPHTPITLEMRRDDGTQKALLLPMRVDRDKLGLHIETKKDAS